MKLKKLLAGILSAAMVLCTVSLPVFADGENVITIGTVDEFVKFAEDVNGGESFKGKTVMLTNDMDLSNIDWTPIGKSGKPFSGTFDGDGHTISNLKTGKSWLSDIGLFGLTTGGAVKNFTVENAEVTGYLDVGVVAGTPYTSMCSNIMVKGDIKVEGFSYVGGAFGKNAYANITNVDVLANPGSYVKADSTSSYRTYIGGLVGFMGEGNVTVSDCDVAIDVIGSTCDIGGILGILHYGNTLQNCTYEGSITLDNDLANLDKGDETEFGALVGVAMNSKSGATKMTNCTANIISAVRCGTDITDSITAYGNNYYRTSPAEKHLYITTVNGVKTLDAKDYTEKEIDSFIKGSYYIDGKIIKTPEEIKNNDNLTDSEKADIVENTVVKGDSSDVVDIIKSLPADVKETVSAEKIDSVIKNSGEDTIIAKDNEVDPQIVAKSMASGVNKITITKLDESETLQQPDSVDAIYFDITLKDADDNHIKEVDVPVVVTIDVEDSSKIEKVIRHHDGITSEIAFSKLDDTHIALSIAKFSDFAVILGQNVPTGSAVLGFKEVVATEPFSAKYELYVSADDEAVIKDIKSGEFTFTKTGASEAVFVPADGFDISYVDSAAKYRVNRTADGASAQAAIVDVDGKPAVLLATLTISGVGNGSFSTSDIKMYRQSANDHIAEEIDTLPTSVVNYNIESEKAKLVINIDFPNAVKNNKTAYQNMTVSVKGGEFDESYNLGSDASSAVAFENGKYTLTLDGVLQKSIAYTVTVSGAGYRTARYTVTMTNDKVLNFWNNAKDADAVVEEGNANSARKVTFLAGDIVKDNSINIYDLSAVVSYFGTQVDKDAQPEYAKYDLNRDGVIDSKDVAYVLVSWGK